MVNDYRNEHCEIAAQMLDSEAGLLDYRLIEFLNEVSQLVNVAGGELLSRQVIALAIVLWQKDNGDDFTKTKTG